MALRLTRPPADPSRTAPSGTAPSGTTPSRRPHLAPLDGLRGLAVAAVLLFHAGLLDGGFLGVDLFFVLSGFLITGLLLRETGGRGRVDLVAFWGRRARRLLPALLVSGVAVLLLVWAFGSSAARSFALGDAPWVAVQGVNWHFVADHVGYWGGSDTRVFAHLWSIAVEWQFYLVWPLLVAALGRGGARGERRVAVLAGVGAAVSLFLVLALGGGPDTTHAYEGTDTRASALLLGALAATAPLRGLASRVPRLVADVLCLLLLGGLVASWVVTDGQSSPLLFRGGLFAHSAACAVLVALLVAAPGGTVGRWVGAALPRRLGEVSYSLYLWHWPIFVLLPPDVLGFGGWPRAAVVIALSVAAAVGSKLLVEDPVRFRARWASGRRGVAVLALSAVVAVAVWAAVPEPRLGVGTVDVDRLAAP